MKNPVSCLVLLLGVAITAAAGAKPRRIELPKETEFFAPSDLPGYALASASCVTCHSVDYIKYQPISSRAYWQATVNKMKKVYGAPIPDQYTTQLVDYLVKTYGDEQMGAAAKPAKQS